MWYYEDLISPLRMLSAAVGIDELSFDFATFDFAHLRLRSPSTRHWSITTRPSPRAGAGQTPRVEKALPADLPSSSCLEREQDVLFDLRDVIDVETRIAGPADTWTARIPSKCGDASDRVT